MEGQHLITHCIWIHLNNTKLITEGHSYLSITIWNSTFQNKKQTNNIVMLFLQDEILPKIVKSTQKEVL